MAQQIDADVHSRDKNKAVNQAALHSNCTDQSLEKWRVVLKRRTSMNIMLPGPTIHRVRKFNAENALEMLDKRMIAKTRIKLARMS